MQKIDAGSAVLYMFINILRIAHKVSTFISNLWRILIASSIIIIPCRILKAPSFIIIQCRILLIINLFFLFLLLTKFILDHAHYTLYALLEFIPKRQFPYPPELGLPRLLLLHLLSQDFIDYRVELGLNLLPHLSLPI